MRKLQKTLLPLLLAVFLCFTGCSGTSADADNTPSTPSQTTTTSTEETEQQEDTQPAPEAAPAIDLNSIPAFSGEPYVAINDNVPDFTDADLTTSSFEEYSNLDALGRCGVAYACIGTDLMPTEDRGSIGQVKPSG